MLPTADMAPTAATVMDYDQAHFLTYARILDAERDGLEWHEGLETILYRDFGDDDVAGKFCWDSHVARAHWIVNDGLGILLESAKQPA